MSTVVKTELTGPAPHSVTILSKKAWPSIERLPLALSYLLSQEGPSPKAVPSFPHAKQPSGGFVLCVVIEETLDRGDEGLLVLPLYEGLT